MRISKAALVTMAIGIVLSISLALRAALLPPFDDPLNVQIPYQGYLQQNGIPFSTPPTGGLTSITVALYDSSAHVCPSANGWFWTDSFSVQVNGGHFSIVLGSQNKLDPRYFNGHLGVNGPIQIAVSVGGNQLTPCQTLYAAPYAEVANFANQSADTFNVGSSLGVNGSASVGTASPAPWAALDVNGTLRASIPFASVFSTTMATTTTRNAWVAPAGVSVTVPQDGTYLIMASARAFCLATNDGWWKAAIVNETAAVQYAVALGLGTTTAAWGTCLGDNTASMTVAKVLKAGDVIALQFWIAGAGTGAVDLIGNSDGGSGITLLRVGN